MANSFYDFTVKDSKDQDFPLSQLKGKPVVIVNVASKCGFTPQYKGLEELYQKYKDQGLVILGFPCNQFGAQEPGTNTEIQEFCELNYGVTFPILQKVEVNGDHAAPIFQFLKSSEPGLLGTEAIKWNFTKFLIDSKGQVLERFAPQTEPKALAPSLEKILATKSNKESNREI